MTSYHLAASPPIPNLESSTSTCLKSLHRFRRKVLQSPPWTFYTAAKQRRTSPRWTAHHELLNTLLRPQGKALVMIASFTMLTISRPAGNILSCQTVVNRRKTQKWTDAIDAIDARPSDYEDDDWEDDYDWDFGPPPKLRDSNQVPGFDREMISESKLENSYSLPVKDKEITLSWPSPSAYAKDFTLHGEPLFEFQSLNDQAFDRTDDWENEERSLSTTTARGSWPPTSPIQLGEGFSPRNGPAPAPQSATNSPTMGPRFPARRSIPRHISPIPTFSLDSPGLFSPFLTSAAPISRVYPPIRPADVHRRVKEERKKSWKKIVLKVVP